MADLSPLPAATRSEVRYSSTCVSGLFSSLGMNFKRSVNDLVVCIHSSILCYLCHLSCDLRIVSLAPLSYIGGGGKIPYDQPGVNGQGGCARFFHSGVREPTSFFDSHCLSFRRISSPFISHPMNTSVVSFFPLQKRHSLLPPT